MRNTLIGLLVFGCLSSCYVYSNPFVLPEDFAVYSDGKTVMDWQPSSSYNKMHLPIFNEYEGQNGGYIAVYTHDRKAGVYSVGGGIYVMGLIRVEGRYVGRIFVPKGYKLGDNITQDRELLEICEKYFPHMVGDMWVGGDTGGYFGIQA